MILAEKLPEGFDCAIEGTRRLKGASVEVSSFRWDRPQEVTLVTSSLFLDLSLPHNAPGAEGRFLSSPRARSMPYGQLFAIPPHIPLECRWGPGRKRSVYCLLDLPELTGTAQCDWPESELETVLDICNPFIRESMLRLARETLIPGLGGEIMLDALCRSLAVEMQRHFGLGVSAQKRLSGVLTPENLRRVRDLICRPGLGTVTLEDLAAECGMSARDFSRMFRKTTGESLPNFVTRCRLDIAKSELASTRTMIKQIAYRCGFCSVSAFSSAFRRETGMTPREYRKLVA